MVDVVSDQTEVSFAESTTGWSGDSFSLENEIFVQGSNSVAVIQTANGANDVIFTGGSWDMGGSHIRVQMSSNIMPNTSTEASNGIQVALGDGTNTAYWTVGGSDTYSGGWVDFFFDVDSTPTSGTVDTSVVTSVHIRINTTTKPRNSTNGWYDNWRFGNGLEINSTTTEAINFQDAAVDDALTANRYGILEDIDDVIFAKGKITLGNAAAAKNCNLVSEGETLYFIDRNVSSTLYGIIGTEGTGATDVDITGLTCKTSGSSGAELDFSAAVTSFSIDGSSFTGMGVMQFATGTVTSTKFSACGTTDISNGLTFTGNTWIDCGDVDINTTAVVDACVFDGTTVVATDLDNFDACHFISAGTGYGVNLGTIAATDTMGWNNTESGFAAQGGTATDRTILVNVASGQTLTINVAAGASTPTYNNTGTGTVSVVSGQVTTTVTVVDIDTGAKLQNAMVYVLAAAGGPLTEGTVIIDKDLTDVNGEASDTRSFASNQPITGRVRRATPGYGTLYKTSPIAGTISSASGLSVTVQMIQDE